ncbi:outer membrane beta-barrel protein [Lunatibacter salilacus]|uniref:outer membrane beta-barrel protein n=1 Tax=Lunatibacter salilacus TaxID=2483804 RepID=UPI00131BBBDE|nr:outer membrane beta-barrel protein [Lunatibacter salilacus]
MKKINVLIVFQFLICIGLVNAQTDKGRMLLGASSDLGLTGAGLLDIGYSSTKSKLDGASYVEDNSSKITNISLLPKIGYFVADNLALGLDFTFASAKAKGGISNSESTSRLLSTGPFARYYIPTAKVLPFVEVNSSFGRRTNTVKYKDDPNLEDYNAKTNISSFGGGIGLAVPLGEKVAFDILAGFNSLTLNRKNQTPPNFRQVTNSLGLKVGFTMFLGSE